MKTLKQLLRQPLKSLLGVILMTLAVAVLCICVGQALAMQSTKKALDERFSTVAIPSLQEDLSGTEQLRVEEELLQWLEEMAQEHPDIIKRVAPNGILSAYIPQLQPYNTQTQGNVSNYGWDAALYASGYDLYAGTTHYDSAMLVITLEEVSQPTTPMDTYNFREQMPTNTLFNKAEDALFLLNDLQLKAFRNHEDYHIYQAYKNLVLENTLTEGYTVTLTGTINQVLSLPDGMRDPMGMTARLTLTLPSMEEIEALGLVSGEQYIVYGMDYFDDYQFIVEYMKQSSFKHISFEPFDPTQLEEPTEKEKISFLTNKRINPVILYNFVPLEQWQYDRFNTVSMTLCAPINLVPYESVLNEAGEVVDRVPQTQVTYTDRSGNTVTLTAEEFNRLYAVPTIARLDGKAEDFLASAQGEAWAAALQQSEVNHRAFSVIGVDEMHQVPVFALEKAKVTEGREFTAEESQNGAKVCIIHEWVADHSGLEIGDTITLSFYGTDYGLPYDTPRVQELLMQKMYEAYGRPYTPTNVLDKGLLRPAASLYFATTPFTETAEYTIVGLWQGSVWPDMDEEYYNFSANTVFVPGASVQSPMEHSDSIAFASVALENGTIRQFHDLIKRAGYAGRFKYTDQGYADIADNFHNYAALGQQIMAVGIAVYAMLLLLFLLLYPTAQRKTVWTMESMGCGFGKRFCHVLLSAMIILVTATVIGGMIGAGLWDRVVAALQATTESSIALQLEPGVLQMVAAAQLLAAMVLSSVVAIFVAAHRGISARR